MPWAAHPRERTSEAASWRQARAEELLSRDGERDQQLRGGYRTERAC